MPGVLLLLLVSLLLLLLVSLLLLLLLLVSLLLLLLLLLVSLPPLPSCSCWQQLLPLPLLLGTSPAPAPPGPPLPQHRPARGAEAAVCGGGQPTQPRLGQTAGGAVRPAWCDLQQPGPATSHAPRPAAQWHGRQPADGTRST